MIHQTKLYSSVMCQFIWEPCGSYHLLNYLHMTKIRAYGIIYNTIQIICLSTLNYSRLLRDDFKTGTYFKLTFQTNIF